VSRENLVAEMVQATRIERATCGLRMETGRLDGISRIYVVLGAGLSCPGSRRVNAERLIKLGASLQVAISVMMLTGSE
jgi:hypothetical protein